MDKTLVELFAGVGGFKIGLDNTGEEWKTVWFSQWEPGAKKQWAHECYVKHFGDIDENTNKDIATVDKELIPDHTLLVGGFPCQDYSVAHSGAQGIEGKKGVLWWEIYKTLEAKHPPFCLFENVDRLIISPGKQRGRDFGIILACLNNLGYSAEWRVVDASLYGAPQKRKRTFIFCYNNNTKYYNNVKDITPENYISKDGVMAKAFPDVINGEIETRNIHNDIVEVSNNFSFPFKNSGWMTDGIIYTAITEGISEPIVTLGSILERVTDENAIQYKRGEKDWATEKGPICKERTAKTGYKYTYKAGAMPFPDILTRPGRTIITSEGSFARTSHIILDPATNKLRILTPIECERLQCFPDDWTKGMPLNMRYFCMGNALVTKMVTRIGKVINDIIDVE